jgi:hypothetical protein
VHVLAKLGLATRSGEREHLWFEVHELTDTDLDGTLVNRPIDVDIRGARAAAGPRPAHRLDDRDADRPDHAAPSFVARNLGRTARRC